jgi:hypothetical protein
MFGLVITINPFSLVGVGLVVFAVAAHIPLFNRVFPLEVSWATRLTQVTVHVEVLPLRAALFALVAGIVKVAVAAERAGFKFRFIHLSTIPFNAAREASCQSQTRFVRL